MRHKSLCLFLIAALALATPVFAQQTGSLSGVVVDSGGKVVAGATVKITSDVLPAARSTVTSESGMYSLLQLLPGTYTIEFEKSGVGKTSRVAIVSVSRDTQMDVILGQQVSEAVTVSAMAPRVDLKSSEVSFNYKREFIQDLPLDRSYLGLLQLIPGVAENGGFAPNGGGSRQDNVYMVDGVNITNPLFGYLSTEINELDILELNAKRGAVSAAAGRAQGFISNAVTKSGTNRFAGGYRFEAIPNQWIKSPSTAKHGQELRRIAGSTPSTSADRSCRTNCSSTDRRARSGPTRCDPPTSSVPFPIARKRRPSCSAR